MQTCPSGFFCFDKNTFILVIISFVIFIVYKINKGNNDLDRQKIDLENKTTLMNLIGDKLKKSFNKIDSLEKENLHLQRKNEIVKNINQEQMYIVDKDHQRVINPLLPPERSYPYRINRVGVPINIPTRGYSSYYQQVGALVQEGNDDDNKKILPLFGKPTYPGSRQWLYYTGTDSYASVKLPVINGNKSCQDQYGCSELMNDSSVKVQGYGSDFKVNIYNLDKPRYLPHII